MNEACSLLNTDEHESIRAIRKKYLQRMKEVHPDNNIRASHQDAVLLNEAYQLLLARRTDPACGNQTEPLWDADIRLDAFCERTVYFQHRFDDGMVHNIPMAKGKYLWNPDAEEFSMLIKSVYEISGHLAGGEDPFLFHSLMQQFVDPVYALGHIPEPWIFRCRTVPLFEGKGNVFSASSRLYISSANTTTSLLSFQDISLNYVVTPLIQTGSAVGEYWDGRMRLTLTKKQFTRDYPGMNARIRSHIRKKRQ